MSESDTNFCAIVFGARRSGEGFCGGVAAHRGDGVMDWARIMRAVPEGTEWLIVEIDRCEGDMMTAVEKSYRFLTGRGYARGRK